MNTRTPTPGQNLSWKRTVGKPNSWKRTLEHPANVALEARITNTRWLAKARNIQQGKDKP